MNRDYLALASRLQDEISELEHVIIRVKEAWKRAVKEDDDYYLDSVAFNLHSFYTGVERMFQLIVGSVDGSKPEGEFWHRELLRQMATEVKQIRPAVISKGTRDRLEEYRAFRHVVRNIYSFRLSKSKMVSLVEDIEDVFNAFKIEISDFESFLEKR